MIDELHKGFKEMHGEIIAENDLHRRRLKRLDYPEEEPWER
ncbi:MAG: hypothetical protein RSD63_10900 [Eubacterium sp.]